MVKRHRKNPHTQLPGIDKHTNRLKILAIDPATIVGWALSTVYYGTWLLKRKDESIGMKFLRIKGKLNELHKINKLDLIVYERPGGRNTGAVIHQSKIIGAIEEWCETNSVEFRGYSSKEMKQLATGKGNSGKPAMIAAAKQKFGYQGNDDNEADALWLLQLAKRDLGIED